MAAPGPATMPRPLVSLLTPSASSSQLPYSTSLPLPIFKCRRSAECYPCPFLPDPMDRIPSTALRFPNLSPEPQTRVSNCLSGVSTWKFHWLLQITMLNTVLAFLFSKMYSSIPQLDKWYQHLSRPDTAARITPLIKTSHAPIPPEMKAKSS